jgi:hypothetical protein
MTTTLHPSKSPANGLDPRTGPSGAAATSRKSEMLLTNVARASLNDELLPDYESFLRQNGMRVWSKDSRPALAMRERLRHDHVSDLPPAPPGTLCEQLLNLDWVARVLALRTAGQPGAPLFLDPNDDGNLTPQDVLQVINRLNHGARQQGTSSGAEGEAGADYALQTGYGWLAAMDAGGFFLPATSPGPSAVSHLQTDLRVDWLTAAVDNLPLEQENWRRQDPAMLETNDGELRDWESLLDDPATDLADPDAFFAGLVGSQQWPERADLPSPPHSPPTV